MIRKIAIIASAMSCLTLGLISASGAGAAPAQHVLTEEGNVGVTFTQNFNPFNSNSLAGQMSIKSLTYEPLFEFDFLKANTQYPWLATAYKWTNGGRTITFTIRNGVKWSDGQMLTPADVAYTFNLIGQNPAANYSGVPQMTNAATVKGDTVSLNFASPAYQDIVAIAGSTLIVPEHLWSRVSNPAKAVITNPIGTGPYVLKSYSSQLVTYKANPHYWGGMPAATQVNIPSYSSNAAATTALANGQLDWAGNDIANIKSVFVNKNPKTNHYYFAGGNTVTLMFNVNYGALGDPIVRAAISAGINRAELGVKAESGYELPATSSSGLILPNQASFLSPKAKNDLSPTSNPSKVASLLSSDGYTKNSSGMWVRNGQEISFNIEDPTAYSDYYAGAQLIANSLQAVGINATVDGVQASQWYSDLAAGTFQSAIHWGAGGANPFQQYQNWLDYNTFVAPNPKSASGDFGRYKSVAAQTAIKKLETTSPLDTKAVNSAVQVLGSILTNQVPVAPLLYGADWNVYSTAHFTGWVTAANPYMDPSPSDPALPIILMHLKVVK
ncbi:MAG: ABC transporter substrate-binding protein [Actinomycetota bacterium]|jgi:peptide/nickel transport system substrate-binding protein|nr:ABC transporter substrate-binding protein [Actinomycetota bacterium]